MNIPSAQPKNPLHSITLEAIVIALHTHYGWEELALRIPINCFTHEPSIRACKKICVNDILPMTIKGNYHDQKQRIYESLPATTH